MAVRGDEEIWFRRRLVAYRAGLLRGAAATRFEQLRADSAPCRRIWNEYVADGDAGSADLEHIPPALVARWDLVQTEVHGTERDVLLGHLQRCAECRADIRFAGHRPSLDAPAALRQEAVFARLALAWAAAATLGALFMTAAWWNARGHRPAAPPGPVPSMRIVPWIEPAALRGDSAGTASVAALTKELLLPIVVPPQVARQTRIDCTLLRPQGTVLATIHWSVPPPGDRAMLLVTDTAALEPGTYRVRFSAGAAGDVVPLYESSFTIGRPAE